MAGNPDSAHRGWRTRSRDAGDVSGLTPLHPCPLLLMTVPDFYLETHKVPLSFCIGGGGEPPQLLDSTWPRPNQSMHSTPRPWDRSRVGM